MKLARINTALLVAIILVNGYLIVMPFVPSLLFWHESHDPKRTHQLTHKLAPTPKAAATPSVDPNAEELIIPNLGLDTKINEGQTMAALNTGPWRRPNTSTPDKGSNTVIAGHRFTYTNPRGIFYYLDKVKIGDQIGLLWHGKKYLYSVQKTEVVPPTDTDIEAPTPNAQLSLYTCTPLWWPKDRLVIIATPQGEVTP